MSDDESCGECRLSPSSDSFMVQCDSCNRWYHGRCCSLTDWQAAEFSIFHCKTCVSLHGPSKRKKRENWHRHDCFEVGAENKPVQCGTIGFLKQLKKRRFPDAFDVITCLPDGSSLSKEFFETNGFKQPFVVKNISGLNMQIPESFDVKQAADILGENCRIDIIDCERQLVFESTLGKLRDYFANPKRDKIYNVISLEFTGTKMEPFVMPPYVVRELSWLPGIWPFSQGSESKSNGDSQNSVECPRTERFLLASAAGSYTDFHIDFGGSSVWYHIVKGSKVFYLAPPNEENLSAYEKWNDAKNRVERFLGDELKPCYKLSLSAGQTLLLPGGWIHSVVTPSDSVVFGGNFLHSMAIPLQLKIFELERRIHTDPKFLFPEFVSVNFFAARHLSEQLKDIAEDCDKACDQKDQSLAIKAPVNRNYLSNLLVGCTALVSALKRWISDEKSMKNCQMTYGECSAIASDLQRSIRVVESWNGGALVMASNTSQSSSLHNGGGGGKSPIRRSVPTHNHHAKSPESPSKRLKHKESGTDHVKRSESSTASVAVNSQLDSNGSTQSALKLKFHISKSSSDTTATTKKEPSSPSSVVRHCNGSST